MGDICKLIVKTYLIKYGLPKFARILITVD